MKKLLFLFISLFIFSCVRTKYQATEYPLVFVNDYETMFLYKIDSTTLLYICTIPASKEVRIMKTDGSTPTIEMNKVKVKDDGKIEIKME